MGEGGLVKDTPKIFLRMCNIPANYIHLSSMWLCFARDRFLTDDMFANYDQERWRKFCKTFQKEHDGIRPTAAIIAINA